MFLRYDREGYSVHVRKAVITAAGRGVRLYPVADTVQKAMLPLLDRDGLAKPVIQIIAEEALESGIEEICVVCAPGDEDTYRRQFELLHDNLLASYRGVDWAQSQAERLNNVVRRLRFAPQQEPLGYGHAVYCAREFVGDEPFLLLLGDHLYVSQVEGQRCAQQLIDLAVQEDCAVAAVQATREHLVGRYGTLCGKRVPRHAGAYQIERIIEKPSVSQAELELYTPGLRAGYFLCFFGMYVLTPPVFTILQEAVDRAVSGQGDVQLTTALQELARRERYLALEVRGVRHDIGSKFGLLQTQLALGLAGKDRDEILALLVELLAESGKA
jgi:UTP--glucose-1-phosphate uridylyltransferase